MGDPPPKRADEMFAGPPRARTAEATKRGDVGAATRSAGKVEVGTGYDTPSLRRAAPSAMVPMPAPGRERGNGGGGGDGWLDRLSALSNAASLLCVVDCTLLPIATVVLPLMGIAAGPAGMELFHSIGHAVAIFFVMPVGCLAAATNYLSHRRWDLTLPALAGLTLVYLANASHPFFSASVMPPFLSPVMSRDLLHSIHCGASLHRATNIAGCALLLGSNLISRRWQEANNLGCVGGRYCGRDDCRVEEGRESFFRWEQPGAWD
mmetsp:Transcript_40097/g.120885  ORF Transcript_40097/g.120885 Transcript_40097/m.120885 type:complete len:264 (+) Transcript_40097:1361-2152(+)